MNKLNRLLLDLPQDCSVLRDEPMSRHTTFKIGGPADAFVSVFSQEGLLELLELLRTREIPYLLLGNGSNLLVSDQGIRGVVIHLDGVFKQITGEGDRLICGAGASLSSVCVEAKSRGLSGLAFAYGIPGSVGGAVFMNAGAYGGEMKDVIFSCRHLTPDGQIETFEKEKLDLSYRHSVYGENRFVILSAELKLERGNSEEIELAMRDFMQRRKSKQPLEFPSAGSVFKRPEGYFAGAVIEKCGLKGLSVGGAQISEKHAGFIINTGNATCEDVRQLIEKIQQTVFRETGVFLECEVKVLD